MFEMFNFLRFFFKKSALNLTKLYIEDVYSPSLMVDTSILIDIL